MTRNDFIKIASKSGYCSKQQATEYCDQNKKKEYTDDDFVEVHRFSQKYVYHNKGRSLGDGRYTSKFFYGDGGEEGNR